MTYYAYDMCSARNYIQAKMIITSNFHLKNNEFKWIMLIYFKKYYCYQYLHAHFIYNRFTLNLQTFLQ